MSIFRWIDRLPEVGEPLLAKAKRIDALRETADEIEAEVMRFIGDNWSIAEVSKAMDELPTNNPAPLNPAERRKR